MISLMRVALYTDASVNQCPGVGGYAVVTDEEVLAVGVELHKATSTRLEGMAVATALYLTKRDFHGMIAVIYTDSSLWVSRYNNLHYLHANGWRSKCGKKVKDRDILTSMFNYYEPERVSVQWVKAHSGVLGNDFADQTADEARQFAQALKNGRMVRGDIA